MLLNVSSHLVDELIAITGSPEFQAILISALKLLVALHMFSL
jgi:hypothetical protein